MKNKITNKVTLIAATVIATLAITACTQTKSAPEVSIKKTLMANLGEDVKIDSVIKTNYAGLYEVRMGADVIYTDEKAQFLFVGNVLSAKGDVNHTKLRVEELSKIQFSDLPLDLAMKVVRGKGERVIAIFEDPNCGYCKQLRHTLEGLDNVTVYTFMYNILSESSAVISKNVWCSTDRNKAWDDWMLNGKTIATAPENCESPNDKVFALGRSLRITGTPTIFFADGSRISGALTLEIFEEKFSKLKDVQAK